VAFAAFGWLKPTLLKPVYIGWMTLALVMGFFMTRVILSILFYSVFSFGGLIIRIMRKDMLDQRYETDAETYWKPYARTQDAKTHLERQF
jgi:hypothetical protein